MFGVIISLVLLIALTALLLYKAIFENWTFFRRQNIRFERGVPFVGTMWKIIIGKLSCADQCQELYEKYREEKLIGLYEMIKPIYFIRDPELIRQITIRDFDHFVNHFNEFDDQLDPMLSRGLFFIKDQRWRDMRATLSPAFTGSKMRIMFSLISECIDNFIDHLKFNDRYEYEMKDLFSRFANDVIATCSFGLKINSLEDQNNTFFTTGRKFTNTEGLTGIKFLLHQSIPKLMKFFRIQIFNGKRINYFRKIINRTINYRKMKGIIRSDMINLLLEANKDEWDDEDLLGQCLVFFFAGFETTSTLLCFMSHELVVNPAIQQRLYEEIVETEKKLNGQPLTYDVLMEMKYMDAVVSETLRRWSPVIVVDRSVNKPYQIQDGLKTIQLHPGDGIWIPIYSIQMDRKYFPNPEIFDPERFSDENRLKIQPGTFLPFGSGPRICIGSRFALMECKLLFYQLLSEFSMEQCERTQNPLKLKKLLSAWWERKGFG